MTRAAGRALIGIVLALALGACATKLPPPPVGLAPKYPAYPTPDLPSSLQVTADMRDLHAIAWRRLQAGDLGGANRDFSSVLKRVPDFYPSTTGLGYVALAGRQFKAAAARFSAALARNDRYLPAWVGKADAELGLGNDVDAIAALERVLAIDPKRDGVAARIELVRFRQIQELIEAGRKSRQAGRLEEAKKTLESALKMAPDSALILSELAVVEIKSGQLDAAETHLERVVQVEQNDTEGHLALAALLESRQKYAEAASVLLKALAVDPRPEWRARATALRTKANLAAIPAEYRETAARPTITRAEVAAYIGVTLNDLLEKAPRRPATVATDVRNHWASPWILPVTRAGVMEVYANHTFQPGAMVRRSDLAEIIATLVNLAGVGRPAELAKWRAARPRFVDLPATNVFYRSAALTVAAEALSADAESRFQPAKLATGADLADAVARVSELAAR